MIMEDMSSESLGKEWGGHGTPIKINEVWEINLVILNQEKFSTCLLSQSHLQYPDWYIYPVKRGANLVWLQSLNFELLSALLPLLILITFFFNSCSFINLLCFLRKHFIVTLKRHFVLHGASFQRTMIGCKAAQLPQSTILKLGITSNSRMRNLLQVLKICMLS